MKYGSLKFTSLRGSRFLVGLCAWMLACVSLKHNVHAWLGAAHTCTCSFTAYSTPGAWYRPQTHVWGCRRSKTELQSYIHVGRWRGTKPGTIALPTYWYYMVWVCVCAPNVSLSLDISTSSSTDKDLFVRLWSFSLGMTGGNGGLI